MTEHTTQTTLATATEQFKTDTQREIIGGHPVNEITDVHGDDLLVCVECGNATLAESPANLANDPCENDGFLPHPSTKE